MCPSAWIWRPERSRAASRRSIASGSGSIARKSAEGEIGLTRASVSANHEIQFDRHDDRHRLTEPRAGKKAPFFGGLDRFLVESEYRIERPQHACVRTGAAELYHALDQHRPLQ